MKKILSITLLLSIFLMASCANTTTVRHRNDYAKTFKQSRSIVVLPTKAEVNMVEVGGNTKRMYDYEYSIEEVIFKESKQQLRKKGYKVEMLSKSNLKAKNLFSNYELLYEDLGNETASLYATPLMEVEKAYNIENKVGRHAVIIGKETKGDILFLVNYLNNVQTNGVRALKVAMFVLSAAGGRGDSSHLDGTDQASILLSMVDAKTGNILWCNNFFISSGALNDMIKGNDAEEDNKRIRTLLSGALKSLPNKSELLDKISEAA